MHASKPQAPSQTWHTFLTNFARDIVSIDFFEEVLISARSPWQNPYVERAIGCIRSDCLGHVIVLNQMHLRRILTSYLRYYHEVRTHLGLGKDCPVSRPLESPDIGLRSLRIIQKPV